MAELRHRFRQYVGLEPLDVGQSPPRGAHRWAMFGAIVVALIAVRLIGEALHGTVLFIATIGVVVVASVVTAAVIRRLNRR